MCYNEWEGHNRWGELGLNMEDVPWRRLLVPL